MRKPQDIIAQDWFQWMNYLSGGDRIINYSWHKPSTSRPERKEIKNIFREIDLVTGLTFKKTKKKNDDLHFMKVDEIEQTNFMSNDCLYQDAILGRAEATSERINVSWVDYHKSNKVSYLEKYVLRHEIGHALGLSHPRGRGDHPRFSSKHTIMSYNTFSKKGYLMYYGFTDLDRSALIENWGPNAFGVMPPTDIVEVL
tara:strand:+ start:1995 stop:2591 length:597 start_codon:yes stop_codon:yes gene_type:complete